jgi:5-methylcytosine-specific restriction endonuclease McrA
LYTKNKDTLDALFEAQDGICFLCLNPAMKPNIDHLEPILGRRGIVRLHASTTIEGHDSRVMTCARCNSIKGDRQPTDIERRRFLALRTGDPAWRTIVK